MIPVDPPSILAAREHLARARELCRTDPVRACWHLTNARLFRCDWPDSARSNAIHCLLRKAADVAARDPDFAADCIILADRELAIIYAHQTGAMPMERTCHYCGGAGETKGSETRHHPPIVSKCRRCGGTGKVDIVLGG